MPKKTDIMSYAAFCQIIDDMEHVEKLTPYGRRSIKHYVKEMQDRLEDIDKIVTEYVRTDEYINNFSGETIFTKIIEILDKED